MKKTKYGDYERRVLFPSWSNYQVHIIFASDIRKACSSRFGEWAVRDLSDTCEAFHFNFTRGNKFGRSYLFFKLGNCSEGAAAHECWRAVRRLLLTWAGVETLEEETVAYHLDFLVQAVADFKYELIEKGVGVKSKKK
jgi:hypothetical protein